MRRVALLLACGWVLLQAHAAAAQASRLLPVMGVTDGDQPPAQALPRTPVDTAAVDSAARLAQRVLLLPFRDQSKFRGLWEVGANFPRAVGDSLRLCRYARAVPFDTVWTALNKRERGGDIDNLDRALELARQMGADYVVFGTIQELGMKRFRAGVPVAGYRNYEGIVTVRLQLLNVRGGEPAGDVTVARDEDTKRYGLTNPASYVPFEREYYFLGQMPWGTDEFRQSLTGKAVQSALSGLAASVDSLLQPPELRVAEPRVVDVVDSLRAYINVGSADAVQNGRKYGVWDKGRVLSDPVTGAVLGQSLPRRVGVVQVEQILSDHLSVVRILEGGGQIVLGYGLRAE